MSKARTLANLISDNAELADGQISVAEVVGAAPTANPTFTGTASGTFSGPLTGNVTGNLTGDVTAPEIDLSAISATIADTAVDVFVYDTSKDSDGGAWRKRTQHTSWYNEVASATRGSRKEFPAVAVIVAESNQVTIYDGDDPDLPMWFKSRSTSTTIGLGVLRSLETYSPTCVSAANGKIFVGINLTSGTYSNNEGVHYLDFAKDEAGKYSSSSSYTGRVTPLTAYPSTDISLDSNMGQIVDPNINDVAMTVLPNAPIDAATGLPVPTIAVATDGGVSVIKDDGTVINKTTTSAATNGVAVTKEGRIVALAPSYYGYWNDLTSESSAYLNGHTDSSYYFGSADGTAFNYPRPLSANPNSLVVSELDTITTGSSKGVTVHELSHGGADDNTGMLAYTTSTYNTGWMNGDIKLATLSDTDDTDVTGSELVTNGTFANTTGWTAASGTTLTASSNILTIASSGTDYGIATIPVTLEANTTYVFTVYINYSNSVYYTRYSLAGTGYNQTLLTDGTSSLGWHNITFTTGSSVPSDILLRLSGRNDVTNQQISNVSIRKAEADRSVNGNGLQVFGTVPKSAVASGADLVAYGGFSNDNYLQQPYNSDLNFGTGDFCVMGWVNVGSNTSHQGLLNRDTLGATGAGLLVEFRTGTNSILFQPRDGATVANSFTTTGSIGLNRWIFFVGVRDSDGKVQRLYLDGELNQTVSVSALNLDSTTAITRLGREVNQGRNFSGKMALWRISETVPSPEQIAKIYEDEKVLFQGGAKATLYGSSDAVTALAHDDSTDLLHVGTSAGRSVFQGLRRVDNTTDAVGAAISASNGLVAED